MLVDVFCLFFKNKFLNLPLIIWHKFETSSEDLVFFYLYIFSCTNFIKHNRHLLSTYFLLDPFVFPYCFYRIQWELIYVLSTVICIPLVFLPDFGPLSGEDLLQKWCNFCFCILLLFKSIFTVEDYSVCF